MIDFSEVSQSDKRKRYFVGVPFVLLLVLLAPLVLVASLAVRVSPFEVFPALWRLLTALRGTHVEVAGSRRSVLLHIS